MIYLFYGGCDWEALDVQLQHLSIAKLSFATFIVEHKEGKVIIHKNCGNGELSEEEIFLYTMGKIPVIM